MGNTLEYLDILKFVPISKCVLESFYMEYAVLSAMISVMSKKEKLSVHKNL